LPGEVLENLSELEKFWEGTWFMGGCFVKKISKRMPLPVCCANLAKNCAGLVQSRRCGSTCFFFSSFFSEICRAKFSKKFQSAVY